MKKVRDFFARKKQEEDEQKMPAVPASDDSEGSEEEGTIQLEYLRIPLTQTSLSKMLREVEQPQKVKKLVLHNNGLQHLPNAVALLTNLEHLEVEENNLRRLPDGLRELKQLKFLYLGGNHIKAFPAFLDRFAQLQHLAWDSSYREHHEPSGNTVV
jgi:Leucine-rich repeat (LRR) protein